MCSPTAPSEDYTIHHLDPQTHALLGKYTIPRHLLIQKIPYYTALFTSRFADSRSPTGTLYSDCVPTLEGLLAYCHSRPLPQNVTELVNTAIAADFLSAPDLLVAVEAALESLCHRFECTCKSCAEAVGPLLTAPAGIRDREVALLARRGSVEKLWKRPLVERGDAVLEEVVQAVRERVAQEQSAAVIDRWVEVVKLRRRVQGSKIRSRWEDMLLKPVMEAVVERVESRLGDGILVRRIRDAGFDGVVLEELVLCVARGVGRGSFKRVWRALGEMREEEALDAREIVGAWARNWWISLAVEGFFGDWTVEEKEKLAAELGVAVDDLGGGGNEETGSRRRSGSETAVERRRRRGGIEVRRGRPRSEIVVGMGRPGGAQRRGRGGRGGIGGGS